MRKILAAIDTSAAATPVLATAFALAKLYHAEVEGLHLEQDQRGTVRALAEAAGVKLRTVHGSSPSQLVEAADADDDVAAMVVGARGLPLGPRPVGATARALLTATKKPLVIVPPQALTGDIERVLVPLDGSRASAAALEGIIQLARDEDVEVVVLHVHQAVPRFVDQTHHWTEAWSREFMHRNCPRLRGVRLTLRTGAPGEGVVEVARSANANLVALGWCQVLAPERGEVVREVLERCTVPILLVPIAHPEP
jgi:nucleotide-binding universal stress UspA family protein